ICILTLILSFLFQHPLPSPGVIVVEDALLIAWGAGAGWLRQQLEVREQTRQHTDDAYRILVETSAQGLVIFQDQRAVFANAAGAELTGYSVDELLTMTQEQTFALTHPDDRPAIIQRLQDRAAGKPPTPRTEFRLIRKGGEIRWFELYTT